MPRTPIETTEQIKEQELIQKIADILHENFDDIHADYCANDECTCQAYIPDSIMNKTLESIRKLVEEEYKRGWNECADYCNYINN